MIMFGYTNIYIKYMWYKLNKNYKTLVFLST